jgi:hypothetical protein
VSAVSAVGLVLLTGVSGASTPPSRIPAAEASPSTNALTPADAVAPPSAAAETTGHGTHASADPPGNNGTVKIGDGSIDNANDPRVPCDFGLSFYNFDAGQTAMITFTISAPSGSGTVLSSSSQLVGAALTSGAHDRPTVAYFSGSDWDLGRFKRQPSQGYHVRLDVVSAGLAGGEKHKTFWLGCPAPQELPVTPAPSDGTPTTPAPEFHGPMAAASPSQGGTGCRPRYSPC